MEIKSVATYISVVFFSLAGVSYAHAASLNVNINDPTHVAVTCASGSIKLYNYNDPSNATYANTDSCSAWANISVTDFGLAENMHARFVNITSSLSSACNGLSMSACEAISDEHVDAWVDGAGEWTLTCLSECGGSPVVAGGLQGIIDSASSTFAGAMTVSAADATSWMGSRLMLVVGSSLGLMTGLLPFIVFLFLAVVTIYFAYKRILYVNSFRK